MAASMTALATVVWSDFAEAAEPAQVMLADELTAPQPVKLAKIEHKQPSEEELMLADLEAEQQKPVKKNKRKRLDFGSFEGY